MKFYCRATVLVTLILLSDSIFAINKCTDNNGNTSYQNKPCKTDQVSGAISIKGNKNKGLPGKSIATVSPYLYNQITKDLKGWVKKELSCDSYKVLDTKAISEKGDIIMDGKGRLFSGIISEKWFISYCGTQATLVIVFQPDGNGGNYVAIAKVKEQVRQPEHFIQHAFDGRKWVLGYKKENQTTSISEFVLEGETVENWSELLTVDTDLRHFNIIELAAKLKSLIYKGHKDLKFQIILQDKLNIILEWSHKGNAKWPAQREIKRIMKGSDGVYILSYSVKEKSFSQKYYDEWMRIIKSAKFSKTKS